MQGSRVRRGRRSWAAVLLTLSFVASLFQVGPARAEDPPAPAPGGKIVFDGVRGGDRDVLVIAPDGSGEVNLTSGVGAGDVDPSFSDDATSIAFASCRQGGMLAQNLQCQLLPTVEPGVGDSNVFIMAPDGSGQTQLTTSLQNDGEPDVHGTEIVFVSHRNLNFEIYKMNVDGSGQTRLTNSAAADRRPAWSPDGGRIAWDRGGSVWVMNSNGGGQTQLAPGIDPAWSPDGTRLAFTRNNDIWVMGADGGNASAVVTAPGVVDREPTWSPDGQWLAFSSNRDGDFDIYRAKVDGTGDVIRVTDNNVDDGSPDWAGDISLTADVTSVEASPASIPMSRIPLQPGAPASDPATAPISLQNLGVAPISLQNLGVAPISLQNLGISPISLQNLGVAPISLQNLGISPISLQNLGVAAPAVLEGLRHIPLSSIPLIPPLSWEGVLAGCTSEPVQNLSLGQVLEVGCDVSGIEWKDIDLTQPPFGGLDFVSILLGPQSLGTIQGQEDTDDDGQVDTPVAPADYWCPRLEAKGFSSCGEDAGGLDATAADLQVAGVSFTTSPLIPLMTFPLANVDVASNPTSPLRSIRVAAFDMRTLVGALKVAELPAPGQVVDCVDVDCTDTDLRLFDADQADAILDDARFEAMLGTDSPVNDLRLGDIVYGLFGDFPIESIPFEQLGILGWGGDVSSAVRYALRYTPVGVSAVETGSVSVTLPETFFFESATPEPDDVTENVLTWDVSGFEAGQVLEADILARPGVQLGSKTATMHASGTNQPGGVAFDEIREVDVEVTDTFEPNGDEGPEISSDVLHVSFTPSGDEVDTFLLPAPQPGSDVTVSLAHQSIDRDLLLCAPSDAETVRPLRAPKSDGSPEPLLADEGIGFDNAGKSLQPDRADDIPVPADCSLDGVSQHRGDSDEFIRTTAGGTGVYKILVVPFLGASSDEPYTLRVKVDPPPQLGACEEAALPSSSLNGTMPATLAPGTKTLVLANENRMRRAFGDAGAQAVISELTALEADSTLGATVLYVDGDPDVRDAYDALDAEPCSPELRNDVVRAINDTMDDLLASSPTAAEDVESVAVVGDPRIVPQGLVLDRTTWGNERSYAQTVAHAAGVVNDAQVSAAAHGFLPSDNSFGDLDPTKVAGGWSYRPDLGVGRLVGPSESLVGQIQRVIDSGETIDPTTAATFATDFMEDAGEAVDAELDASLGSQPDHIGESWTLDDLREATTSDDPADLFALLAHMDHRRALPPGSPSTLFDADEFPGSLAAPGRTGVTMGCHSGYLTPGTPHWAEAISGQGIDLYFAQTGYGLGSRNGIALSERVTQEFVRNLLAGQPAGVARANAQNALLEEGPVLGVYEEKALEEATLYGWPGYQIPGTAAPSEPGNDETVEDPETGTRIADYNVEPEFELQVTADGKKFYTVDGRAHGPQNRPLLPVVPIDVAQDGREARGWTIEGLSSLDELGFRSTPARGLLSGGAVTPPDAPFDFVASPSVPARITPSQKLVFAPALFQGDPKSGLHRRYVDAELRVYYGTPGEGGSRPLFREADIAANGSEADGFTADLSARVTDPDGDGTVARVTALVHDEGNTWRRVTMERDATDPEVWSHEALPFEGPGIEAMFFAVDDTGLSAMTTSKALYFGGELGKPSPADPVCFEGPFPPDHSKLQAGSTNPVKFRVAELPSCTETVTDPEAVREIRSYVLGEAGSVRIEDLSRLTPPTEADEFFKFEWQTEKGWAGKDVVLEIETRDGRVRSARFSFK